MPITMQSEVDDDGNSWPSILPPVITAPANGLTGLLVAVILTISLGPFVSGIDTHVSTDYEIVDASNGNIVYSSLNNILGLLSLLVPALTLSIGKTYRIRARFNGAVYVSNWSTIVTVST